MTLKYPQQIGGLGSDYVTFTPYKYKTNFQGGPEAPPQDSGVESVALYMPNSTPGIGNANSWASASFLGPLGNLRKTGGAILGDIAATGFEGGYGNPFSGEGVDALKAKVDKAISTYQDKVGTGGTVASLGQAGMQFAGGIMGVTANQQLALARGNVFNPNIELFYSAPGLRPFTMSFDFVPKNATEAELMNQIILNFKKYSAPKDLQNGMFEIPYVWQVQYMTGKEKNRNMNQFKKAACTNIQVQANAPTPMHVAHQNGVPIITTMVLSFMEVDIIMREDHEKVKGQGF